MLLFNFSNSSANDLVRVLLKNMIKRERTPPELTRVSNGGWFCKFKINRSMQLQDVSFKEPSAKHKAVKII